MEERPLWFLPVVDINPASVPLSPRPPVDVTLNHQWMFWVRVLHTSTTKLIYLSVVTLELKEPEGESTPSQARYRL